MQPVSSVQLISLLINAQSALSPSLCSYARSADSSEGDEKWRGGGKCANNSEQNSVSAVYHNKQEMRHHQGIHSTINFTLTLHPVKANTQL